MILAAPLDRTRASVRAGMISVALRPATVVAIEFLVDDGAGHRSRATSSKSISTASRTRWATLSSAAKRAAKKPWTRLEKSFGRKKRSMARSSAA